ncbi:hypothetical protein [Nocardia alni]|uniref:hypothetical protein n=1 Tax=Nocardia alni TaxID=2815723 RepID=UPI0020B31E70|nr:hypothetical protein [Nocardia alni]
MDGTVIEDTPKSDAGGRIIPLGKDGVAVLKAHRLAQKKDKLSWGGAWVDSGKMFAREDGSAFHPLDIRRVRAPVHRRRPPTDPAA